MNKNIIIMLIALGIWACEDKSQPVPELDSIVVSPVKSVLMLGETVQFSALIIDKSNSPMETPVVWLTTNDQVATITNVGLLTAVGRGEANVYATIDNVQGMAEILVSTNRRRVLSEMFTSST